MGLELPDTSSQAIGTQTNSWYDLKDYLVVMGTYDDTDKYYSLTFTCEDTAYKVAYSPMYEDIYIASGIYSETENTNCFIHLYENGKNYINTYYHSDTKEVEFSAYITPATLTKDTQLEPYKYTGEAEDESTFHTISITRTVMTLYGCDVYLLDEAEVTLGGLGFEQLDIAPYTSEYHIIKKYILDHGTYNSQTKSYEIMTRSGETTYFLQYSLLNDWIDFGNLYIGSGEDIHSYVVMYPNGYYFVALKYYALYMDLDYAAMFDPTQFNNGITLTPYQYSGSVATSANEKRFNDLAVKRAIVSLNAYERHFLKDIGISLVDLGFTQLG